EVDNMLKLTGDGRRAALDMRQVDLNAPDGGGWDSDDWPDELTAEERRQVEPDDCGDQGGMPSKAYRDWVESGERAEFQRACRSARANRPQDF
ncbi:hypothetical protein LCGC14_2893720, partial [marine sediment metagenome]